MDTRFVQAHKEARWALGLTLLYLAVWLVLTATICAYQLLSAVDTV